jgi:selenocysteine lyase/cysteine desulfurase
MMNRRPRRSNGNSTAAGYFEQGTLANAVSETLAYSLEYIQTLGVENIQEHSQSLLERMRREIPKLVMSQLRRPTLAARSLLFN